MRIRTAAVGAAGAIGLAVALVAGTADAKVKWDMAAVHPPTSAPGLAHGDFVKMIKERTKGEIEITVHYSGALGYQCLDHLELVEKGAVPIARQCTNYLSGYNPVFSISTVPFILNKAQDARILSEVANPYLQKAYDKHNQLILYGFSNTPGGLWAKEPKTTVESLKNWKLRAFDENSLKTFKEAGTAAVSIPFSDVIPALSTGAIGGVLTAGDAGFKAKFSEFLRFFIEINFSASFGEATLNKDVFNKLPKNLQQALIDTGRETTKRAYDRMESLVGDSYKEMRAAGVTVIDNPPKPFMDHLHKAGAVVRAEWLKKMGPDGQALLDNFNKRRSM